MKTFTFNNGEVRLESQIKQGHDFETACIFWGCFDKDTKKPLPYVTHETTQEELLVEKIRLEKIQREYEEICEKNERTYNGNKNVANATNIHEFLNAYL